MNLEKLQEYINKLTVHAAQCGGEILISGEKRNGLAAIISGSSLRQFLLTLQYFRATRKRMRIYMALSALAALLRWQIMLILMFKLFIWCDMFVCVYM